jgi:Mn2+/Fe2+ NRAMP family transporter
MNWSLIASGSGILFLLIALLLLAAEQMAGPTNNIERWLTILTVIVFVLMIASCGMLIGAGFHICS